MQLQYELNWCDYYAALGVRINAEPEVVKAAYTALAKKVHPDATGNGGDQRMKVLNEAREILSNPQLKAEYDKAWMERYNKRFNAKTENKQESKTTGSSSGQPRQSPKSEGPTPKARRTADSPSNGRKSGSKRTANTGARQDSNAHKSTGARPAADPKLEDADHKLVAWPAHRWQQAGLTGAVLIGTSLGFLAPILWIKLAAIALAAMGLYSIVDTRFVTQVKRAHKIAKITGVISIFIALLLMGLTAAAIAAGVVAIAAAGMAVVFISRALLKAGGSNPASNPGRSQKIMRRGTS